MNDFVVFRVFWNAVPLSEEAAGLLFACIGWYVRRNGNSVQACERRLNQYKLKVEQERVE